MTRRALAVAVGVALAAGFWDPLWRGGGFVGGDVYSYYFPQKTFYADALRRGELSLWNPLAGFGYPVLGESQTGALYPPNLVLYALFDVHTAYHVGHLLHYVLAFLATAALARRFGITTTASCLAGIVYVYGWFPARTCWEWAIVGGAWLPAALWAADRAIEKRTWRSAFLLSVVLAAQMLAGHYHIAFLTQMAVAVWIVAGVWGRVERRDRETSAPAAAINESPSRSSPSRTALVARLVFAVVCGFALASVQLIPSVELMRLSQRAARGEHHNPQRGRVPWSALTEMIGWVRTTPDDGGREAEWSAWCSPLLDRDAILQRRSQPVPTNQVEAHLYFGIVPLGLALIGAGVAVRRRDRAMLLWLAIGLAALIYATGILVPWMDRLPGFGWFHGPGRYGLLTTLAAAMLAGTGFDALRGAAGPGIARLVALHLVVAVALAFAFLTLLALSAAVEQVSEITGVPSPLKLFGVTLSDGTLVAFVAAAVMATIVALGLLWRDRESPPDVPQTGRTLLTVVVFAVTLLDLWMAGRLVTYSPMVADPPLRHLAESPVRRLLANDPVWPRETVRLFAPGGNLPTILGVSSTPPYFTFGPAAYFDPQRVMPSAANDRERRDPAFVAKQVAWLKSAGVTHVLSFERLDEAVWPVELLWSGIDPFLNPAWGRHREPIFLSRLRDAPGRARFEPLGTGSVEMARYAASSAAMVVDAPSGGRVVLADLAYPGWIATVDGESVEPIPDVFRVVDVPAGKHAVEWKYRPASVYWGLALSGLTMLAMIGVSWKCEPASGNGSLIETAQGE